MMRKSLNLGVKNKILKQANKQQQQNHIYPDWNHKANLQNALKHD